MVKIAICNDDSGIVKQIESFIIEYQKTCNYVFEVKQFYDGDILLKSNVNFD